MTLNERDMIRSALIEDPAFEAGTAYVRAKLCCQILTKQGQPIPSWMVIRAHIGKGSANDVSRGVKDFRTEHATLLRKMDGLPAGIPENLTDPILRLWQAAVTEATALFDQQSETLMAQQAAAENSMKKAMQESVSIAIELNLANEKVAGIQLAFEQEKERATSERAAREQAERMAEKHISDLTNQRNSMVTVVEANTTQLKTLTDRLEDERRRALMEIDHARQQVAFSFQRGIQEGEQNTIKVAARLNKEIADVRFEYAHMQRRHSELASQYTKMTELINKEQKGKKQENKRAPMRAVSRPLKKLKRFAKGA